MRGIWSGVLLGPMSLAVAACSGGEDASLSSKVFKYDGSVQCEGAGTTVDEMQRELTDAGVRVYCGQKAGDGYAYPAVCGAPTGLINIYEIDPDDQARALSFGFEAVGTLPEYHDHACEGQR